jgi:catechol 2,3-dioxygenase-like lactoylglutathione lyase family enzyme
MSPSIVRIVLYVKDIPKVAAFYRRHFGMVPLPSSREDWLELKGASGGCTLALHQASKGQKSGAAIKVVFGAADVRRFVKGQARLGLRFGAIHEAPGFEYANAKDPAGNSISVSRAF